MPKSSDRATTERSRGRSSLRRLHHRLLLLLVVYFFAGSASQKLIPGVDEIFPFFGWSLFSKVPPEQKTYSILLLEQNGKVLEPAIAFLKAPDSMVAGNRFIARKVIQKLGRAQEAGISAEVERLRRLLEENHLHGFMRYELTFERYDPLEKWRKGESLSAERLGVFESRRPSGVAPEAASPELKRPKRRWRKKGKPQRKPQRKPQSSEPSQEAIPPEPPASGVSP